MAILDEITPIRNGKRLEGDSYNELVNLVQRPYFNLSKDEYDHIVRITSPAPHRKATDTVMFRGVVCSF